MRPSYIFSGKPNPWKDRLSIGTRSKVFDGVLSCAHTRLHLSRLIRHESFQFFNWIPFLGLFRYFFIIDKNAPNRSFLFQNFPGGIPLQNISSYFHHNSLSCLVDAWSWSAECVFDFFSALWFWTEVVFKVLDVHPSLINAVAGTKVHGFRCSIINYGASEEICTQFMLCCVYCGEMPTDFVAISQLSGLNNYCTHNTL